MQRVFTGFATLGVVIADGALLAHLRVVDLTAQRILSQVAFFVGSPALLVPTLSRPTCTTCFPPPSSPRRPACSSRWSSTPCAPVGSGVDGPALLAVVVMSALPTAQNIHVHATRDDRGTALARDTILITTVGAVPVILLVAALLA